MIAQNHLNQEISHIWDEACEATGVDNDPDLEIALGGCLEEKSIEGIIIIADDYLTQHVNKHRSPDIGKPMQFQINAYRQEDKIDPVQRDIVIHIQKGIEAMDPNITRSFALMRPEEQWISKEMRDIAHTTVDNVIGMTNIGASAVGTAFSYLAKFW